MFFRTMVDTNRTLQVGYVIMLGDCTLWEENEPYRVDRFPDAGPETMRAIASIPVTEFTHGINLVVSSELAENDFDNVRRIQKYLIYCHVKYIWFPSQDTATPDPLNIGGDKGPLADYLYRLNVLEKIPLLMTNPRANCLQGRIDPAPVLLLLPGNSLSELSSSIRDLSKRFVTVCLSKTLGFCMENGIVPDIVVQLDTHWEQENFYPKEMDFSRTWLFALSAIPKRQYLDRFAGIFWLDTFGTQSYGDQFEIRNSWLSSFIPMLGVAELFSPQAVVAAGADLAITGQPLINSISGAPYTRKTMDIAPLLEWPGLCGHKTFLTVTNSGSIGDTTLQFMATAFEAESIAAEFTMKYGTACYTLSHASILDKDVFQMCIPEDLMGLPELDRDRTHTGMQRAFREGRLPDQRVIKKELLHKVLEAEFVDKQLDILSCQENASLDDNPLLSAGKLIFKLHPVASPEDRLHVCKEIAKRYSSALNATLAMYRLKEWAERGKQVPVLCYPSDVEPLQSALGSRFPKARWEFLHTWTEDYTLMTDGLLSRQIPEVVRGNPIVLMSRKYAESAEFLISLLPMDRVIMVEELLEQSWP